MGNGAKFWEVTVTASHANLPPAGTCMARKLCWGSREGLSCSHRGRRSDGASGEEAWEGCLCKHISQTDQLSHQGEREGEVPVITEGTEKRGVCWFLNFFIHFFEPVGGLDLCSEDVRCREQETVRA